MSNGQYSGYNSDGYYMWETASKEPQNHFGYLSSTQIVPTETGALIFLNNDEVFTGFSVMFDGDPFNGGQIVNNTEWASEYQASGVNSFGMPTQDWFMNLRALGANDTTIMGGSGPWTGEWGGCIACGVVQEGSNVGGLTGWAVKIGDNGAWLPFDIDEMLDGVVFPGNNWDFLDYINQTHGVTEIQQGEKVQLRAPNGTYSNIYVSDTPFTLGN